MCCSSLSGIGLTRARIKLFVGVVYYPERFMVRLEVAGRARADRSVGKAPYSHRKLFWFPASKKVIRTVWLVAILAVIVGSALPSESGPIQALERIPLSDKVEHVAMYAVLAFLPA